MSQSPQAFTRIDRQTRDKTTDARQTRDKTRDKTTDARQTRDRRTQTRDRRRQTRDRRRQTRDARETNARRRETDASRRETDADARQDDRRTRRPTQTHADADARRRRQTRDARRTHTHKLSQTPHNTTTTIVKTADSFERRMNPVALSIINPRKEYWPSRGTNQ